jgi:TorA maturation chaperone TorD
MLDWSHVNIRLKGMVYHLLGNSYYYSNKEKELVDLVEFLKHDKNYQNHPLVKWANTPVTEKQTK